MPPPLCERAVVLLFALSLQSALAAPLSEREQDQLSRRITEAQAVGRALARVQNDWAQHVLLDPVPPDCTERIAADRGARARLLGADWRERLEALATDLQSVDNTPFATALQTQRTAWAAAAAWQAHTIEPWARRCTLTVLPGPGFPEPGGPVEPPTPVAIIGLSGMICPQMTPASLAVVVVDGAACVQPIDACDCTPRPVLPGAALQP